MAVALLEARRCAPIPTAYCVGACVTINGALVAQGHSREIEGNTHAEECCLAKLEAMAQESNQMSCRLASKTIYTTLEPCGLRLSGKLSCAQRIIDYGGFTRCVIGGAEPDLFVEKCVGARLLELAGIVVEWISDVEIRNQCLNAAIMKADF